MKAVYLLLFALLYLSVSAQDVCPCQENNYQFSQYSWNQMEKSDLETAFILPEEKVTILQLVSKQEPLLETSPLPSTLKKEKTSAEATTVSTRGVSSKGRNNVTNGKKPRQRNPRFKKSKRKGKKKYKGTCPKI